MKKRSLWLLVAALFMVITANVFADIAVKKLSDAEVEVTFTFKMPGYKEVYIAGTMNGWSPTNDLMTKNEDGSWTFVLKVPVSESITWKYVADGNWIADLKAPAFVDDGFGGKNGVLNVAEYLAAEAGPAAAGAAPVVAAGPKLTPINFGTWSILRADAKFLTRDLVSKSTEGYEFDSAFIEAKSYWKLGGDLVPGLALATEIQVMQGKCQLYALDMDGDAIPTTTWETGLQNLIDSIFHPFNFYNGNANPIVGHFKATVTTPFAKFATGYNYTKGTNHSIFGWETSSAADTDAGAGYTEISLGDKFTNIADMVKLDVVVAPNKRAGTDGVYSWVTATILNDYVVDLAFNTKTTEADVFQYFNENENMLSLGASAKFGELSFKLGGILNYQNVGGELVNPDGTANYVAAGLSGAYSSDMIGVDVGAQIAGDSVYTIYGDGGAQAGKFYAWLNPTFTMDPMVISLSSNITLSNKIIDSSFADKSIDPAADTKEMGLWFKPQFDIKLADYIPLNMSVSVFADMAYDVYGDKASTATVDEAGSAFVYNEADLKVNIRKLVDFIPNMDIYFANKIVSKKWKAGAYPLDLMRNSLLVSLGLKNNMGATVGAMVRTNMEDYGTNTALADKEAAQLNAFGASLGYNWVLPVSWLKKPNFYANVTYNFDPYDDGQPGFDMGDDGAYRADTDIGQNESHLRMGLIWSF